MGALHFHPQPVSLTMLLAASRAIALVRPADPPQRVETRSTAGPATAPDAPAVSYRAAVDRYQVIEWLRAPDAAPAVVEIDALGTDATARGAHDEARGLLGHVHHVLLTPVLEVPAAWRELPDERRLLFLAPIAPPRFDLVYDAIFGPAALDAVRAAVATAAPPPPPRSRSSLPLVALLAALIAIGVVIARC